MIIFSKANVVASPLLTPLEQLQVLCFAYESIKKFNKDLTALSEREINLPDDEGKRWFFLKKRFL